MQCYSTTFIYHLLGVTVLTFRKKNSPPPIVYICYYLGTVNPFYSFYNNLLDFYLTSCHTLLPLVHTFKNDIMIFFLGDLKYCLDLGKHAHYKKRVADRKTIEKGEK